MASCIIKSEYWGPKKGSMEGKYLYFIQCK